MEPSPPRARGVRNRSRYLRPIAAALIAATLVGLPLRYGGVTLLVSSQTEDPNAIIVLGSHEWERLPVAAALAHRYAAARVLLTYPVRISPHNCHRCPERLKWLTEAGVDRKRVTVLPQGVTSTYDEARAAAAFAQLHEIDRLVVVTSPYHGRRALATFRHLFDSSGLRADIGLATPSSGVDPRFWWLRHYDRGYVAYEWAAVVSYAIRFGISPLL